MLCKLILNVLDFSLIKLINSIWFPLLFFTISYFYYVLLDIRIISLFKSNSTCIQKSITKKLKKRLLKFVGKLALFCIESDNLDGKMN